MKRVLFLTNYASPYRVRFFDELGKQMEVTVLFSERAEEKKHRAKSWFVQGEGNFKLVQLRRRAVSVKGKDLCLDVVDWLKKPWDAIVLCGYSSPTFMYAMGWLQLHKIPFYMEVDGGLIRPDSALKHRFKKLLVSSASWWLSTGDYTTEYLVHYGAKKDRVFHYPFTSLYEKDLRKTPVTREEKAALREQLGIGEKNVVLSIGQFIHRKGFDVLLQAAQSLDQDTGIYIIGGEPTEEYRNMKESLGLNHVHFLGFMSKEQLALYYQASDLFVLPTREDIWGLVINEAMAYGLAVITTDRCVAGLELVEEGVNGYIVPVGDHSALADRMVQALSGDCAAMGAASLEKIRPYTIENMAGTHVEILSNRR